MLERIRCKGVFNIWEVRFSKTESTSGKICKLCNQNYTGSMSKNYCGSCSINISCNSCGKTETIRENSPIIRSSSNVFDTLSSSLCLCEKCRVSLGRTTPWFRPNLESFQSSSIRSLNMCYIRNCKIHGKTEFNVNNECARCLMERHHSCKWCDDCSAMTFFYGDDCYNSFISESLSRSWCSSHVGFYMHYDGECLMCRAESEESMGKTSNHPTRCYIHGKSKFSIAGECLECSKSWSNPSSRIIRSVRDELNIVGETTRLGYGIRGWKADFERYLVDSKIRRFVYCSWTREGILSVVGQSGSKLVQTSGSDVWFSRKATTSFMLDDMKLHQNKNEIVIWHNPRWTDKSILQWETVIGDVLLKEFGLVNSYSHRR